jgi:hypothetical protein
VRDYIVGQLTGLGLRVEVQSTTGIGTRYQEAGRVENIIGLLPGSAPGGKVLLVVVHYDGVEAGPAASDDGAGVAAVLETVRALRSQRPPLRHDVMVLFTDGEESGLLGAAAFVREHPRARDVAFVLNFEARGTSGRSFMFETGAGNLDAARLLRSAGDVTAGSVFTTVYRALPNDTDLSDLSALGVPALNFAFTAGVERYHTTRDDAAHLNRGSLQHHGAQMLALARTIAGGTLPRPRTADGVFFDLPLIGLVVYPVWVAYVLALLVAVLLVSVVWPPRRDVWIGAATLLVMLVVSGVAASRVSLDGPALWSGWYGAALAAAVVAFNVIVLRRMQHRWPDITVGALLLWAIIAIASSVAAPAVSYLFAWPVLFALVAARSRRLVAEWISAAFALLLLSGFTGVAAVVMLGVSGVGAVALAVFATLLTWLVAPLIARVFADWRSAAITLVPLAAGLWLWARSTVRHDADHPARTALVYAENADDSSAFFGAALRDEGWTRSAVRDMSAGPRWTMGLGPYRARLFGHSVVREGLPAPTIVLAADSVAGAERTITFRVNAPPGVTAVVMRAGGVRVSRWAIDGRVVDTTHFRRRFSEWGTEYWNVPAEGALVALTVASGSSGEFQVAARRPGIPASLAVPARPVTVVPSQQGDVSVVYRSLRF